MTATPTTARRPSAPPSAGVTVNRQRRSPNLPPARRPAKPPTPNWVLLIQAGWVVVALVAIATFPDRKSEPTAPAKPSVVTSGEQQKASAKPLPMAGVGLDRLFSGGSASLIARTVGHAEGTRNPDGSYTRAYYGHTDPGNGVWNLGSFSFQHCREARYNCTTPEAADTHQLQRLQKQALQMRQRAIAFKQTLTLEEELNAIDLANQAPLAALSQGGYIDHLAQVRRQGKRGQDAILEARVWSFWNPQKQRWDAPGLGNTAASIRHDQTRRMLAIARALAVYQSPTATQIVRNQLNVSATVVNPYAYETQRSQHLWWESGYWDARLNRGRQVPAGYESAYDQGFKQGTTP